MLRTLAVILTFVFVLGCSGKDDKSELQRQLNSFLGDSFDGQFTIVEVHHSVALNNYVTEVDTKFTESGIKALLAKLPPEKTQALRAGLQYSSTRPSGNREAFLILLVRENSANVVIQFGDV